MRELFQILTSFERRSRRSPLFCQPVKVYYPIGDHRISRFIEETSDIGRCVDEFSTLLNEREGGQWVSFRLLRQKRIYFALNDKEKLTEDFRPRKSMPKNVTTF